MLCPSVCKKNKGLLDLNMQNAKFKMPGLRHIKTSCGPVAATRFSQQQPSWAVSVTVIRDIINDERLNEIIC
jgi:hypothetical protein